MNAHSPETFGGLLRTVRIAHRLKHKEAAALAGCAVNTWSNAESGPHAVIGKKRIEAFANAIKLDDATRDRLLALHASAPISPFQEKQRERWERLRAERKAVSDGVAIAAEASLLRARVADLEGKLAASPHLRDAFVDLLDMLCGEGALCYCTSEDVCALCKATRALELGERFEAIPVATAIEERFPEPVGNPVESVDNAAGVDGGGEFG